MKLRQTINLILIIKFILKQNKQLRRVKIKIQKLKENKEGSALSTHSYFSNNLSKLKKYQEAIKCYEKAISINPKESAWSATLHKLKNYKDAVQCQDQALSIYTKSIRLKRKADSLFELGNKYEAQKNYLAAQEQGSDEKDYIYQQNIKLEAILMIKIMSKRLELSIIILKQINSYLPNSHIDPTSNKNKKNHKIQTNHRSVNLNYNSQFYFIFFQFLFVKNQVFLLIFQMLLKIYLYLKLDNYNPKYLFKIQQYYLQEFSLKNLYFFICIMLALEVKLSQFFFQ